jgi:hypothetical protein
MSNPCRVDINHELWNDISAERTTISNFIMNLKKGQYVVFMTNQPAAHLNEMFGYNDLGPDNFEKMEEVGRIKTVIDESTFLINTGGFYCVVDTKDVLRVVQIEDVSQEELELEEPIYYQAPNVHSCQETPSGNTVQEKCENAAREAMNQLFPEDEIKSVEFIIDEFKKSDLQELVNGFLAMVTTEELQEEVKKASDEFDEVLRMRKFKEYYTARINVYDKEDEEKNSVHCYYAAVDMCFEEVIIMRNGMERSRFCTSLGPGYDDISRLRMGIINAFVKGGCNDIFVDVSE